MPQKPLFNFWIVQACLVPLLLVTGCVALSPTEATPTEGNTEEASGDAGGDASGDVSGDEGVTLRFYTSNGDFAAAANDLMVQAFEEKHPGVEVEVEFAPSGYADKVFTMAAAGNLPDVLLTADIYTAPFVDAGVLLDMQPLADVDDEVDIADVYESILGLGRVDGNPGLYMIPVSLDNTQVYYNKTMWEEAGAPMPSPDWTWDDLIAQCKIIQEANPDVYCIGIGGQVGGGQFNQWGNVVPWIRGYGGDVLSEDGTTSTLSTPEALAGLQAYADLWVEHGVAIPLGNDLGGNCFINQRCAAWPNIPIFAGVFRDGIEPGAFEWDVELIPSHPEGRFTGMGTFGFAVSAGTEHPDLAWDFVKTMLTQEGQRQLALAYRAMPLLRSMAEDGSIFDELEPPPANYRAFVDGQQYGILPRTYPVECGSLYTGQVSEAFRAALETIISGQATAAEVFPAVDAEIQACLDRAQ